MTLKSCAVGMRNAILRNNLLVPQARWRQKGEKDIAGQTQKLHVYLADRLLYAYLQMLTISENCFALAVDNDLLSWNKASQID